MNSKELFEIIVKEISENIGKEPILEKLLNKDLLKKNNLSEMLAFQLANKLSNNLIDFNSLYDVFIDTLNKDKKIIEAVIKDVLACYERDAACDSYSMPLLYFKGFHSLQVYRINHYLWLNKRKNLALFLQNRVSEAFGVDIHPAARIGSGIMIDHATGVVIGETAVLGSDISLMHGVTLGGSGKHHGDRHPKVNNGVMIGANSSILGNVRIGTCAKIGAGSVVITNVADHITVVGVPAKAIGFAKNTPSKDMNQNIIYNFDDYEI